VREEYWAFDGKMVRSLAHLTTRPGLPTAEWIAGRRALYIPPLRLFLLGLPLLLVGGLNPRAQWLDFRYGVHTFWPGLALLLAVFVGYLAGACGRLYDLNRVRALGRALLALAIYGTGFAAFISVVFAVMAPRLGA
jgi:hypothetical protein